MVIVINGTVIEIQAYKCAGEHLVINTINYSASREQRHHEWNKLDM